jgi:hypothetical protein|tara:strand:- start:14306 stop:16663 length:2358 start_codon:yes stop_codon:yes gene_type:complete
MADNAVTIVEKNIAFKIAQQFPAHYREHGSELVAMVEHYYKFVETEPNMGVYNSRKLFEYRDIGTTLSSMIIYFKKKYMADLPPLDDDVTVKFVIRNILDLYRRKGTEAGLMLFFRMFYKADIQVTYPAKFMFKPSDSIWKTGIYLQMFQNNNEFYSGSGILYEYKDLLSRNIYGSISKAKAIVDKINFVYLNGTLTPIIYITNVKGKFLKNDDIVSRFAGEDVAFGRLNGSADSIDVVTKGKDIVVTTDNKIGDILSIKSTYGKGGAAIVTDLQAEFTGTVEYTIDDGGWGYTIGNTRLLVSNQVMVLPNPDFRFVLQEVLQDTAGNRGIVVGQNSIAVGVKMDTGDNFVIGRNISTVDRLVYNDVGAVIANNNFTLTAYAIGPPATGDIFNISAKNESSPGPLYPDTGVVADVKVETLSNIESISLITDVISNFLNVPFDSADYNATPPAIIPMSGTASPVTRFTPLNEAFDLEPFDIGTIVAFENINPGQEYINDTFSLAIDAQMVAFERVSQILLIADFTAGFTVGDTIEQVSTGTTGIITGLDNNIGALYVLPYSYYGFQTSLSDSIIHKGNEFDVLAVSRDYSTKRFGENASISNKTLFSQGRISDVEIRNSGFGYVDGEKVILVDKDGVNRAQGTINADSQGITAGFWGSQSSHINGYWTNPESNVFEYYDGKMKIQDSDYYQEYSYEIKSTVDPRKYDKVVKDTMHLAGSKLFSNFIYEQLTGPKITARMQVNRKDDYVRGGDPIVGPNQFIGDQTIRADNFVYTSDDTVSFTVDNG